MTWYDPYRINLNHSPYNEEVSMKGVLRLWILPSPFLSLSHHVIGNSKPTHTPAIIFLLIKAQRKEDK